MRYLGIGIMALLVMGCTLSSENGGPETIGYSKIGTARSTVPGCSFEGVETDAARVAQVEFDFAFANHPDSAATSCVFLTEKRADDSPIMRGILKQKTELIDKGGQCLTIHQPAKDTILVDGNNVIVDVAQDPCIPFFYAKDLIKG